MNVLGAMSKLQQWALIPAEATQTMQVIMALDREANSVVVVEEDPEDNNNNSGPTSMNQSVSTTEALTRAFFFRGFAQFHLHAFPAAEADFKKAMELSPGDTSFREEWNQLQAAIHCEKRGLFVSLYYVAVIPIGVQT